MEKRRRRHPDWLKVKLPDNETYGKIKATLRKSSLHTVCEEARCPNLGECFCKGTATFLILGDVCTRNCRYCNITSGTPKPIDEDEPRKVAESVRDFGLRYAVVTSVTRDDLDDQGSGQFAKTIKEIKAMNNGCKVEVLIPDFNNDTKCLENVMDANPDVLNHNIEVVKKLFPKIRPQGDYDKSLSLLKQAKKIIIESGKEMKTKSGMMVGLGESFEEIIETLKDLKKAHVDIVTIGQYLQPNKDCVELVKYYTPEEFKKMEIIAMEMGFERVLAGPLVRSSYHAEELQE